MRSSSLTKAKLYVPEILLFAVVGVGFFGELIETGNVNYLMMTIAAVLTVLVVSKNKYLAAVLSVILGVGSCYFLLAVFAEFSEFSNGRDGLPLLIAGGTLFTSLLVISIFLPRKYFA